MRRSGEVERATRIEGDQEVASSRRLWMSETASPVYRFKGHVIDFSFAKAA
jgi:hypothetical protein